MRRRIPVVPVVLTLLMAGVLPASAERPPLSAGEMRLVHMTDGHRSIAPKQDLSRLREASLYKDAKRAGVDITKASPNPLITHAYANGRVFYVFYKTLEGLMSDRPYVIQKIKKTIRNWKTADSEPEEKVTYQVEVFKTIGEALKRPDQHFGNYGLYDFHRREIRKEYVVGIGEVKGKAEGTDWPFKPGILFTYLQRYQPERGIYDDVTFTQKLDWSLTVSFDKDTYRIHAPELGIDAPKQLPPKSRAKSRTRRGLSGMVLLAGLVSDGKSIFDVDLSTAEPGTPFPWFPRGAYRKDVYEGRDTLFEASNELTASVRSSGKVRWVRTRTGFAGKTDLGIGHGSTRPEVMTAYGTPKRQMADAPTWRYPGIAFRFDGYDEVVAITFTPLPSR